MAIGFIELLMVFALASVAIAFYAMKTRFSSIAISLAICMAVAMIVTPADLASCLFIGALLFAAYQIGSRFQSSRIPAAS